jgi:hypothetical protein
MKVADHIGVKHPAPNTKQKSIMTTDFLITVVNGDQSREIARTVKYAKDLEDIRVIEKLEIERLWWEARGVDWGIVTEHEIPEVLAKNVENLHTFVSLEGHPQLQKDTDELIRYPTQEIEQTTQPLSKVTLDLLDFCDGQDQTQSKESDHAKKTTLLHTRVQNPSRPPRHATRQHHQPDCTRSRHGQPTARTMDQTQ